MTDELHSPAPLTPRLFHIGAQNDALFIISGRAPAMDNDYPNHEADRTCIAKVFDEAEAKRLVALANGRLTSPVSERGEKLEKDEAYRQRNVLVAAFARMYPSGIRRTNIEGWSEDWHGCVYIDLPSGQISYHYHDSQAHLFAGLPPYTKEWDGSDKKTVEDRLLTITAVAPTPNTHLNPAAAWPFPKRNDDAARMRALCAELDLNRRASAPMPIRMPVWDAMCEAIGNDCSGDKMRAAIDAACSAGQRNAP